MFFISNACFFLPQHHHLTHLHYHPQIHIHQHHEHSYLYLQRYYLDQRHLDKNHLDYSHLDQNYMDYPYTYLQIHQIYLQMLRTIIQLFVSISTCLFKCCVHLFAKVSYSFKSRSTLFTTLLGSLSSREEVLGTSRKSIQ